VLLFKRTINDKTDFRKNAEEAVYILYINFYNFDCCFCK